MRPIIISIQPKWVDLIRAGKKTIELRRRFPSYLAGSRAFVYESSPVRRLTSVLRLGNVYELSLETLWQSHGNASCVEKVYFDSYFSDKLTGFGIEIVQYGPLKDTLDLNCLRQTFNFTPPQSWAYAPANLENIIEVSL